MGKWRSALEIVEGMMTVDAEFWRGRRVLVTGHTGFKGSWLSLWLQSLGAQVHGLALAPDTTPNLFSSARVGEGMESGLGDIRDFEVVRDVLARARPEVLIHMAAQPLVRRSYAEPVATYATNVMGTVHVLEAARYSPGLRAIVIVTTDKCYENREWPWGYREDDALGGRDPYSSSKACAELVTAAYRRSFLSSPGVAVASARAGNVIGGGDWAKDRLVPDVLRAFENGSPAVIRNPVATRPWQHVMEPLSGYLRLAEQLFTEGTAAAQAWNFGPAEEDVCTVRCLVEKLATAWGPGASWTQDCAEHPHEARDLKLDTSKARSALEWSPRWNLDAAARRVTDWHRGWLAHQDARALCLQDIADFSNAPKHA